MTKHTPQQFEHDGFNSPREVEVAQARTAKHTPGPLHVFSVYAQHEVRTASDTLVAVVQNREDARLFAAAPDLLDALQTLLGPIDGLQANLDAAKKARAAIARATGAHP